MIVIGGRGSIWGAIVGAAVISLAPQCMTSLTDNLPTTFILTPWLQDHVFTINNGLYGLIVLLFLLYQPDGIVPAFKRFGKWGPAGRRSDRRCGRVAPSRRAGGRRRDGGPPPRRGVSRSLRISRVTEFTETEHRSRGRARSVARGPRPPPALSERRSGAGRHRRCTWARARSSRS